jgi:acyl-[acyl carrier protein]--UDP-N-acetylglucosamine O-acyltransferase
VHQFTFKVGAYCFIANNAAVTPSDAPYVMAVGQPG